MISKRPTFPFLQAWDLPDPLPRWEYHAHSTFSDGHASLVQVTEVARQLGITRLIFTEHTEPELTRGKGWFRQYVEGIRALRQDLASQDAPLEIGIGLEVPVVDARGSLGMTEEMVAETEFILGAVHAYPGVGWAMDQLTPDEAIALEFTALMQLAENPLVDAIAHPGGICQVYITPFPMSLFEEVVIRATQNGIAIEINPAYQKPVAPYLDICRRHGAWVVPGSNAHHPVQLGDAWRAMERWRVGASSREELGPVTK